MSIEELTKQQIILLCVLVAFVSSIAVGITVVTLLEQSPQTIATPINKIIRQTVERVVESDTSPKTPGISTEESKLLGQLKTVGSFVATVSIVDKDGKESILANGLFFGDNKIIVTPALVALKEGETLSVKSIFGIQPVKTITTTEEYTILDVSAQEKPVEIPVEETPTEPAPETPTETPTETPAAQ